MAEKPNLLRRAYHAIIEGRQSQAHRVIAGWRELHPSPGGTVPTPPFTRR